MTSQITCPKCHQPMEQGFMLDRAESPISTIARWAPGPPKVSSFFGFKSSGPTGQQIRAALEIVTFRCSSCGYLESYAPTPPVKP